MPDITDIFETSTPPTPPPKKYTFPRTAFENVKPTSHPFTVRIAQVNGLLAVVEDPLEARLWQVVHMPSGLSMSTGTKAQMLKALARFSDLPVDWERVHFDRDLLKPFLATAKRIKALYGKHEDPRSYTAG